MVYQLPQTYSFACPQAKQRAVSLETVSKQQGLTQFKNLLSSPQHHFKPHQINLYLKVRFLQYPSLETKSIHQATKLIMSD